MYAYIEINGRGGEVVISSLADDAYRFWLTQSEDKLYNYVLGNKTFNDVPEFADFIKDENNNNKEWFELDDRAHFFGADPRQSSLKIDVEFGGVKKNVMDEDFSSAILKTKSRVSSHSFSKNANSRRPSLIIFSYEKGCFFESKFEITGKEDFKKIVFNTVVINGTEIFIYEVKKGNISLDNLGGDSIVKAIFIQIAQI